MGAGNKRMGRTACYASTVALLVTGAAVTAGCGSSNSSGSGGSTATAASKSAPKKVVIGLSNQTMAVTFPVGLAKGAQREADKLGAKLIVLDSKGDVQKQGSDMQDLAAQKVSGILLVPNSPGPAKARPRNTCSSSVLSAASSVAPTW